MKHSMWIAVHAFLLGSELEQVISGSYIWDKRIWALTVVINVMGLIYRFAMLTKEEQT